MTKICTVCGETKDNELFAKDAKHTNGTKNICKSCAAKKSAERRARYAHDEQYRSEAKKRAKEYRDSHKDKILLNKTKWNNSDTGKKYHKEYNQRKEVKERYRKLQWKRKYGISPEDADRILSEQGNACAICGDILIRPYVDHCHSTGKIRGFLCSKCNVGLGYFKDNVNILKNAISYLENKRILPNGKVV